MKEAQTDNQGLDSYKQNSFLHRLFLYRVQQLLCANDTYRLYIAWRFLGGLLKQGKEVVQNEES